MRAAVAGLALLLTLTGCASASVPTPRPEPVHTVAPAATDKPEAEPEPEPLRLAVVGDSISAWSPAFAGNPAQSWVVTATDNDLPLVGGWAVPGAKLAEMEAGVVPVDADVLVIMAGTNDTYYGTPLEARLASIDAIVATIGAPTVILSATAPFGYDIALGAQWNADLAAHAALRGWDYVDPWAGVRQADGRWYAGTDYGDAVHPSPATAAYIGGVMRQYILDAAR